MSKIHIKETDMRTDFPGFRILFLCLSFFITSCGGSSSGSGADIDYVALGASDATGIGATPLTNGYVFLIEEGVENNGQEVNLINLGIPGAEIDEIDDVELPILDRSGADLVTVFTGPNDLIDGDDPAVFEQDLNDLLMDLRNSIGPSGIIAVANVPDLTMAPRFRDDPDPDVTSARISAFNQAIARQAAAVNASLVNLFSLPINDDLTSDQDGFHPNDRGHRVIADAFLAVILPQIDQSA